MRLHNDVKKGKKLRSFLSILLVVCLVLSGSSQHITTKAAGNGEGIHQHDESCYEEKLVCELEGHTDECYEETKTLICEQKEAEGHTHGEECYKTEQTLICEMEETEDHGHGEECYKTEQTLICEQEEAEGYTHGEGCYETEQTLTCEDPEHEHTHTDECYVKELVCGMTESTLTKEQYEQVDKVNQMIAALPSYEEIAEQLEEYEDDEDAYYEYLMETMDQVMEAYNAYMELDEELRQYVVGAEEMLQLAEAFGSVSEAETLALYNGDYGYYQQWQINAINSTGFWSWGNQTYPVIAWGANENVFQALKKSSEKITGDTNVQDWVGVMVRSTGLTTRPYYKVTKIVNATKTSEEDAKEIFRNVKFADNNEFMVLFYNKLPAVEVGDEVALSFGCDWTASNFDPRGEKGLIDYTDGSQSTGAEGIFAYPYKGGLGVMVLMNNMNPGTKTEDRTGLRKLGAADGIVSTKDLITVNLYDYTTRNINDKYWNDNRYPVFKSSAGVDANSYAGRQISKYGTLGFGDTVVTDDPTGQTSFDQDSNNINHRQPSFGPLNKFWDVGYYTVTDNLVNGYPAVKANNGSLNYLFSSSVTQGTNVDGLFKYDKKTGTYSFNSRENHAEFNRSENKFDLYNATITPNYIQYPFGNFLPYNTISATDTTRVAEIGRDDMVRMAASARQKALASATGSESRREYENIADALACFIALMDDKYAGDWDCVEAAQQFNNWAEDRYNGVFANMYNIDYDIPVDFHFGMSIELQFVQPKDGKVKVTKADGTTSEKNMVYKFSGDDDVWVYVDGKLLLDLSGIHTQVGGEIDFAEGKVRYYPYDSSNATVNFSSPTVVTFEQLGVNGPFKDYSTHTLNFYYLERGSGSSVCSIEFNLPVMPKNSIAVGKELSTDKQAENWLGNPDFFFRVLKVENGQKTENPYFATGTTYKIYNSNFQNTGKTGTVGEKGIFTLKAGEYAVFPELPASSGKYYVWELLDTSIYEQYGTVTVDNKAMELKEKSTIEGKTYIGVQSEIKDPGNSEQTTFIFNNQATTNKFGQLDITKMVVSEGDTDAGTSDKTFDMIVKLDGTPLAKGTTYKVGTVQKTVESEGIITLKAGETASIEGILAGTQYTVQESKDSSQMYAVTYSAAPEGNGIPVAEGGITGMVLPKKTGVESVKVTVTNTDLLTASVEAVIGGTKKLVNPDGKAHEYTFSMVEVQDEQGTEKAGAEAETVTVKYENGVTTANKEFGFGKLIYRARDYFDPDKNPDRTPHIFYYKITETAGNDSDTIYDNTAYIVKVTVSMDSVTNVLSTETAVIKDGTLITGSEPLKDKIVFTNQLTHDLTIAKELEGEQGAQQFSFLVEIADKDGLSVKGKSFKASIGNNAEKDVIFDTDGKAEITVKVGKALTIKGLPYGLSWKVTETGAGAYTTRYVVNGDSLEREEALAQANEYGQEANASLTDDTDTVTFINSISYELPSTGGPGTILYTLAGICMMLGACLLYRYTLKGRRYRGI